VDRDRFDEGPRRRVDADVQEWFKTNYGPNNTVLVLAGDITPEEALAKVEKYYGEIPPGPPMAKQEAWIAKRTGTHRGTVQDRVPQARIYRTWNVPGAHTTEEPLLDLAARVLGQGKTSRLYKRLVYKDQIATSATAGNDSNEIGGQFDLTLTARPGGDIAKVEAAADEELQRFLKDGPTPPNWNWRRPPSWRATPASASASAASAARATCWPAA
jgi:zinc protease